MKTRFRFLGLMVLALAAAVAVVGPGSADKADAAGADISCNIPNDVVCTVSSPLGIKRVVVKVDFGGDFGVLNVVDKSYNGCPSSVEVAWDPIVPNYQFEVETCSHVAGGGNGGSGGGLKLAPHDGGHDPVVGGFQALPSGKNERR